MRFTIPTIASASFALLSALINNASAQGSLPDSEVPNVGGGVYKAKDPALANYTVKYTPPFTADYGGYYSWAVNNNTVVAYNVTALTAPLGITNYGAVNTIYPFFVINEANLKKDLSFNSWKARKEMGGKNSRHSRGSQDSGKFNKLLHIMFENEVYDWTMSDPWWQLLAERGKTLTNSHGITHPSLPNYVAIVSGDFFGIDGEDWYNINTTTIFDLLDAKGLDYATYAEWYTPAATSRGPNDCNNNPFPGPLDGTSADWSSPVQRRLDIPALLFTTYTSDYTRCSKIYNATANLTSDVKTQKLPDYSFYVPDMLHNGHDPESDSDYAHQSTTSGMWLNAFLDMYLEDLTAQGTVVVATFDEATWKNDNDNIPNNDNHIATLLFGHGITPNTKDDTYITHYGALRGAITNFGLGSLGRNDTNTTNGDLSTLIR